VLLALAARAVLAAESAPHPGEALLQRGVIRFRDGLRTWSLDAFSESAALFERAARAQPDAHRPHYWLAVARFHELLHLLDADRKAGRKPTVHALETSQRACERAVKLDPGDSESWALLSTLHGMRIAMNPATALWRGARVLRYRSRARALAGANPRTHYLLGVNVLQAPGFLGGPDKALALLARAEQLFEREAQHPPTPPDPAWGRDSCLVFLARAYDELQQPARATACYEQALELNPDNRAARGALAARRKEADAP
jgi:tetratricopeptide (TPR) repeat protein